MFNIYNYVNIQSDKKRNAFTMQVSFEGTCVSEKGPFKYCDKRRSSLNNRGVTISQKNFNVFNAFKITCFLNPRF